MSNLPLVTSTALPSAISVAARSVGGDINRAHFDSAITAAASNRDRQAAREVGESDNEVGDRDADGREPWRAPERTPQDPDDETRPPEPESGHRLDCIV